MEQKNLLMVTSMLVNLLMVNKKVKVFIHGEKSKWAGDRYEGSWKNDERNGHGTYESADDKVCL